MVSMIDFTVAWIRASPLLIHLNPSMLLFGTVLQLEACRHQLSSACSATSGEKKKKLPFLLLNISSPFFLCVWAWSYPRRCLDGRLSSNNSSSCPLRCLSVFAPNCCSLTSFFSFHSLVLSFAAYRMTLVQFSSSTWVRVHMHMLDPVGGAKESIQSKNKFCTTISTPHSAGTVIM